MLPVGHPQELGISTGHVSLSFSAAQAHLRDTYRHRTSSLHVHRKDNLSGPGALFGLDDIIAFLTSIQVNGFQVIREFWGISCFSIFGGSRNNAVRKVLHVSLIILFNLV
jgi:hypothetical protein